MKTWIQELKGDYGSGNRVYIKRDDLLPFSMGGNKVRIAEAFWEDCLEKGCDAMIIYGSRHSNLCRVLSDLCCSRNMPCYMICSQEKGESAESTNNTFLIEWTGTQILVCSKTQIAQTVEACIRRLENEGKKPYYIYGDQYGQGNEGTAAMAYARAYSEIQSFEKEAGWEFDEIFCPSGTGATQSGLICGHLLAGDSKKIMGVMISSRETKRARMVIETGIRAYFQKAGKKLPAHYEEEILLLDEYRKGGYGLYDEEVKSCIIRQYCQNGIGFDPVYTGKAFLGMQNYLKEHQITNHRILFLHTGGAPLFYDLLKHSMSEKEREGRNQC